jgi:hypothetical protein
MDPVSLAASAMQIFLSSAGSGVGQGVADLVRGRLSATAQGQQALAGLDPQAPGTVTVAEQLLARSVQADERFAAALAQAVAAARPEQTAGRDINEVHVPGRARNIHLGPMTVNNAKGGWMAAAALVVAAVAVIALAVYGGQQLVVEVVSPETGSNGTAEPVPQPVPQSEEPSADTVGPTEQPIAEPDDEILAEPDSGARGDTIVVTGSGFQPGERVWIRWGANANEDLDDTTVDADGRFRTEVIIPDVLPTTADGTFLITAEGLTSDTEATTLFFLTAGSA